MTVGREADAQRVRDAIRRGYDQRAPGFGAGPVRRHRARGFELPPIFAGAWVLDAGCGTGRSTQPVLAAGAASRVVGLDLSRGMLRRAHAEVGGDPRVALAQGDAERLPLAGATFDVVLSFRVLSHLPDLHTAFREMARALRSGGLVDVTVFGDRALERPVERMLREALHEVLAAAADPLIALYRPPSIAAVEAAGHAAGLTPDDVSARTTYGWTDPDALVEGLLIATTYVWTQLDSATVARIQGRVRAQARAAATARGIEDWDYVIHYRGRKPSI